jgi:hypothetical protein
MQATRENLRLLDLNNTKKMKTDFIRALQSKEGNFPCFRTTKDSCIQISCCWRSACLLENNVGKKSVHYDLE